MLVDWFTVTAQALNFVVLVLLLRRFLYGPITRAMAERQRGIDESVAEAARLQAEAVAHEEQLRLEAARLTEQRDEQLRRLREEIADARRARLAEVRAETDELQRRWRAAVVRERDGFLRELRQQTGVQIVDTVRRALRDLAGETLESQVIRCFVVRLEELDRVQRHALAEAAERDGHGMQVRTAFDVPELLRKQLTGVVQDTFGPGVTVRFETTPAVLGGIELRAGGLALAWTFDEYLDTLEEALGDALGGDWQPDDAS